MGGSPDLLAVSRTQRSTNQTDPKGISTIKPPNADANYHPVFRRSASHKPKALPQNGWRAVRSKPPHQRCARLALMECHRGSQNAKP